MPVSPMSVFAITLLFILPQIQEGVKQKNQRKEEDMSKKLSPWCKSVKHALIDKDMSITELADELGMSRGHVSAVVNGRAYSQNTVKLISDYFNIPFDCGCTL